jgi:hypothetical protein
LTYYQQKQQTTNSNNNIIENMNQMYGRIYTAMVEVQSKLLGENPTEQVPEWYKCEKAYLYLLEVDNINMRPKATCENGKSMWVFQDTTRHATCEKCSVPLLEGIDIIYAQQYVSQQYCLYVSQDRRQVDRKRAEDAEKRAEDAEKRAEDAEKRAERAEEDLRNLQNGITLLLEMSEHPDKKKRRIG